MLLRERPKAMVRDKIQGSLSITIQLGASELVT